MPPELITELNYRTLTRTVNEVAAPLSFLTRLLYPNEQTLQTETIELARITAGRTMAPFVRKNGEAILVGGTGYRFATVEAPNIRLKQPFTPSQLLFARQPEMPALLAPGQSQKSAAQAHIARDLKYTMNRIQNTEEWMVAQSLRGSISYSVAPEEVYNIDIGRASANDTTLTVFWDDADPTLPRPLADIHAVKRIMSGIPGSEGLQTTDCILGSLAASALLELVESGNVKMLGQAGMSVSAGQVTFVEQFSKTGAIYLGSLGGVRFWEYSRTVTDNAGNEIPLIRPKYAEFISASPESDRVLYYGAIPDIDAMNTNRAMQTKRFSKSWITPDPSQVMYLVHTRPLPWPRKPNATVSVQVVE